VESRSRSRWTGRRRRRDINFADVVILALLLGVLQAGMR
jgi:hypothetical protein